jgi:hypothetical protein
MAVLPGFPWLGASNKMHHWAGVAFIGSTTPFRTL